VGVGSVPLVVMFGREHGISIRWGRAAEHYEKEQKMDKAEYLR